MSPAGVILVIVLLVILFGGVGGPYVGAPWTYGYGYGHVPMGIFGVILLVIIILLFMGRL